MPYNGWSAGLRPPIRLFPDRFLTLILHLLMKNRIYQTIIVFLFVFFLVGTMTARGQVELTHQSWLEHTLNDMQKIVEEKHTLNLLCFPGARRVKTDGVDHPHF